MSEDNIGYIYILTNPSFKEYVKIGYADNVEQRLKQLNKSECTPFAFRVYATYKVNVRLSDMKIHNMIDKLNPNLRSIDNVDGKKRIREFYAMRPEDAYEIFEAMAEIHGLESNLKLWKPSEKEKEEEQVSEEILDESNERRAPFAFSRCNIGIGEEIFSLEKPDIKCTVYDDKHVLYNNKIYSLSVLAKEILGWKWNPTGPNHFTYKGEILNDLRMRIENN